MENSPNRIIWHHTADASVGYQSEKVNLYHKRKFRYKSQLGFWGGYHALIEKDGTIVRYRADTEVGAHDLDENINTLGVALAGNFDTELPTAEQKSALQLLLLMWIKKWGIPVASIEPHRKHDSTSCPGKRIYDAWAQEILNDIRHEPEIDLLIAMKKVILQYENAL